MLVMGGRKTDNRQQQTTTNDNIRQHTTTYDNIRQQTTTDNNRQQQTTDKGGKEEGRRGTDNRNQIKQSPAEARGRFKISKNQFQKFKK
jgi:hypothetical protein